MKPDLRRERQQALALAKDSFLRAAERCMTAEQEYQDDRREAALAEAVFFGALGMVRAAEADRGEAGLRLLEQFLEERRRERAQPPVGG